MKTFPELLYISKNNDNYFTISVTVSESVIIVKSCTKQDLEKFKNMLDEALSRE